MDGKSRPSIVHMNGSPEPDDIPLAYLAFGWQAMLISKAC